jgi:hypothetical protein
MRDRAPTVSLMSAWMQVQPSYASNPAASYESTRKADT